MLWLRKTKVTTYILIRVSILKYMFHLYWCVISMIQTEIEHACLHWTCGLIVEGCKCYPNANSFQSCPTLCNPMDYSLPDSFVYRILQVRVLEWVAMLSPRGLPDPAIKRSCLMSPALERHSTTLPLLPPGQPSFKDTGSKSGVRVSNLEETY